MIKAAAVTLSCLLAGSFLFLSSCSSNDVDDGILKDSTSIKSGGLAFAEKCAGCHNFQEDGIGPHLAGVTSERSVDWLKNFIHDPQKMINHGDPVAKKLFREFKTMMPAFGNMPDTELDALIAFIHTHKKTELHLAAEDSGSFSDPIPDTIAVSDLEIEVKPVIQIPMSSNQAPKTRIVKMDFIPGTKDLFIVDLRGNLYRIVGDSTQVYMDMKALRPKFINKPGLATGFGSFAFHPQFLTNGLIYTTHTESPKSARADFRYHDSIPVELQWVLTEWKTDPSSKGIFQGKGRELLRVNMPTGIHGVQEITFNKFAKPGDEDYGLLYVGIGDGGSTEIRQFFVSDKPTSIWGSIIRIDPAGRNSKNKNYGIPARNPFAKSKDAIAEIYAWGFRNPHKINWSRDGRLFAANVGELNVESLYLLEPGKFYGWPIREGSFLIEFAKNKKKVLPLPADDSSFHITYPVAEFDHDEGTAICGGFEYQGNNIPSLKGKYVFGDMGSGKLFYVDMKDLVQGQRATIHRWNITYEGKKTNLLDLCNTSRVDMRYGMDADGELYIFTKQNGKVYKLVGSAKS